MVIILFLCSGINLEVTTLEIGFYSVKEFPFWISASYDQHVAQSVYRHHDHSLFHQWLLFFLSWYKSRHLGSCSYYFHTALLASDIFCCAGTITAATDHDSSSNSKGSRLFINSLITGVRTNLLQNYGFILCSKQQVDLPT